jgi:intracellular septation protein A
MTDVFAKLASDFFSTILFLVLYLITGNIVVATAVAIAGAVVQVVYSRVKGQPLSFMTYASTALVIVLGSTTLLTHDPRFVLAKPSIAHFAIGAVMLKRGWMLRYVPPIVSRIIPEYVTGAGYAWAGLMFALGSGVIAVAATGDIKLWALYVSVVAFGAKLAAFAVQFAVFYLVIASRFRAGRVTGSFRATRMPEPDENTSGLENAVDGNWNLAMNTPRGDLTATLSLKNSGGKLTGTSQGADGTISEIFDGTASGNNLGWKISVARPTPVTLEFTGQVAGDSISGQIGIRLTGRLSVIPPNPATSPAMITPR